MKKAKIVLNTVKNSDGWMQLATELKYDSFKKQHPDMDEDDLNDLFYNQIVSKKFKYGEFADLEIEFDEEFNIVGGKVL